MPSLADIRFDVQSGAGKMADMFGRLSKARERIQDTDQKILAESEICKDLTKEHETELQATTEMRDLVEETAKQLKHYEHDTEMLKLQLKDKMHDVEKCLQQGKLVTMGEVKAEIKERYVPIQSTRYLSRSVIASFELVYCDDVYLQLACG
jgi:small-conductance mechanosensitive channel